MAAKTYMHSAALTRTAIELGSTASNVINLLESIDVLSINKTSFLTCEMLGRYLGQPTLGEITKITRS